MAALRFPSPSRNIIRPFTGRLFELSNPSKGISHSSVLLLQWSSFGVSTTTRRRRACDLLLCLGSKNEAGDGEVQPFDDRDLEKCSADNNGQERDNGDPGVKFLSAKDLMQKLKRYGVAGLLSYGLLNTTYYLTTFLLVWFYVAPAPGRMGYAAAVQRFLKIMAMVWAGSQVTKIIRAGGALALAPFVDKGLSWFTVKYNFKSEGKVFAIFAGLCWCMALILFFGLTLLWA
ncbi:hypothetical protein J5N97_002174 [Dioscorea zingiberensis]|uniref:Uncharacterized protein n=1 Tax=Dioscorea zingiberensis TaxID=325984 RepID=A0A9D5D2B8_9LILI|nr:hypothetical protein J5N97_002174 [Dioscorea zingiberensis]